VRRRPSRERLGEEGLMTPIAASVLMVMWAVLLLMLLGVGVWSVLRITARRRPSRARSRRS